MKSFKNSSAAFLALILLFSHSCKNDKSPKDTVKDRVDKLLAEMTIDEKIGQMSQLDAPSLGTEENLKKAVRDGRCGSLLNYFGAEKVNEIQRIAVEESRLRIPLIIGRDVIHGYKTIFPIPLGMAASWNPELVKGAFRIAATEASSQGIKWKFAHMIDITWDPRWGRISEGNLVNEGLRR